MQRILMIRMGSLGDIIHTLPAAATLRKAFPDAEIGWVVERHWASLVVRNPHLDRVHFVDTRAWRKELAEAGAWRSVIESLGEIRRYRYTVALDFQGLWKSAVLARLSDVESVIGFDRSELREKAAGVLYTRRVSPQAIAGPHVIQRNLALANAVGANEAVLEFCCPPAPAAVERMRETTAALDEYAVLSPSAGWPAKQWPPESFAALALRVRQELGLAVVVQSGPGDEAVASRIAEMAGGACLLQPTLDELIALLRGAAVVVAGDTGPLHLGAAAGRPVVGIFGPTDPARNGPFGPQCRVVRAAGAVTDYSRSLSDEAIRRVSVDDVFDAIRKLMSRE